MNFYLVVEKTEYTTSAQNAILPKNQTINLAIYTSLKKSYAEAIGYFNAIKLENGIDTYLDEFYTCRSFNLEEVKNEITNQEKELTLAPCVVVGKEELKETSLSDPKIYTVTHTSVLIQKFPERLCIS